MADVTRWRLTEEINRGGAGVVWLAYDTQRDRRVAVKFVDARTFSGDKARRRFLREGQVLTRLEHPNIMRVHEVGGDDAPYIVMDYVPGGSLEDRLERDGRLADPREAAHIACQMALALDHAHQLQVIHRDLKPANVLLRDDGEPLVTDFGLAKDLGGSEDFDSGITTRGHSVGTPGFWSPEQALGKSDQIGPATDVYGLGGTLYALLTGQPPHQGESLVEVFTAMEQGIRSPQELRPELDDELVRICMRCLARDPQQRYPTARAVAEDLEGYLNALQEQAIEDAKLRTQCPVCGRAIVVPALYVGRKGRCPGCKRILRLRPGTCAVSLQLSSDAERAPAPRPVPAMNPLLRPPVAGVLVGLVAVASAAAAGGGLLVVVSAGVLMAALGGVSMRLLTPASPPPPPHRAPTDEGLVETIRHTAVITPPGVSPLEGSDPLEKAVRLRAKSPHRNA